MLLDSVPDVSGARLNVCMVGGADHGAARYVVESHLSTQFSQLLELFRCDEPFDWEMIPAGL